MRHFICFQVAMTKNGIPAYFSPQKTCHAHPLREWPTDGETVYEFAQAECSAAPAPLDWESCQAEAEKKHGRENGVRI